ncbi:unnamed protein product [Paramecium octaurelia]|uniref:Uncharacterized protein n=1 Tax=Paramecium octaurelia TaxID=43137 RepID=A0A8S1WPB8_PAROT|nr:unnamed protein product [Paramecium octaurelia]
MPLRKVKLSKIHAKIIFCNLKLKLDLTARSLLLRQQLTENSIGQLRLVIVHKHGLWQKEINDTSTKKSCAKELSIYLETCKKKEQEQVQPKNVRLRFLKKPSQYVSSTVWRSKGEAKKELDEIGKIESILSWAQLILWKNGAFIQPNQQFIQNIEILVKISNQSNHNLLINKHNITECFVV